jgi:hypothetical protein
MRSIFEVPDVEQTLQTVELVDLLPDVSLRPFGNAQSFNPENRRLYYTLTGMEPSGSTRAVIVHSGGELLPYTIAAIQREGFYPLQSNIDPHTHQLIPPSVLCRWSRSSLYDFLSGKPWESTPAALYRDLTAYLTRFIYHDDPRVLKFLALHCMTSYTYTSFESLPIVLLTGESGTGKTRTMEILTELAFNGRLHGSVTAASFAREIQQDQPVICIDEIEDLAARQELLRLLRVMYRSSGNREVCGTRGGREVSNVFAPAILVNIKGVDEALRNRIIEFQSVPRARPVERLLFRQQAAALQNLRDALYRFACSYVTRIHETYVTFPSVSDISDRVEELWLPIFTIAKVIHETEESPAHASVLEEMTLLAYELSQRTHEQEQFTARSTKILVGLYFFLQDHGVLHIPQAEINAGEVADFIRTVEGLKGLYEEEVSRILNRNRINTRTFRRRVRLQNGSTNPLVHYTIDVGRLLERVKAFGTQQVR